MNIIKKLKQEKIQLVNAEEIKSAILEIKTHTMGDCSNYDPIGICKITDCLQCENCSYRLSFDNGQIVETNDFEKSFVNPKCYKYVLQFIDPIKNDVFKYLLDDTNDYRIIRTKDNVVMRFSKEEQLKVFGRISNDSDVKIDNSNRKRLILKNSKFIE